MKHQRPKIMGVLNLTPDSFSDGGKFTSLESALDQAKLLSISGADIIDVGGESTRPGAERITPEEEQNRVIEVIREIAKLNLAEISIDTMNSSTAQLAVENGATIINDVSGGLADPEMFSVAAKTGATLVISHWRGFSNEMDKLNQYEDIAKDVANELEAQVEKALAQGVSRDKIVVDPGLGFAKDMKQNWELVARLDEIEKLGLPILVGASRKRFLAGALDEDVQQVSNERRDVATAVLTALLLQRKLWGVRVHNVLATADAINVVAALREAE
jgi:dihydropteroate synthase